MSRSRWSIVLFLLMSVVSCGWSQQHQRHHQQQQHQQQQHHDHRRRHSPSDFDRNDAEVVVPPSVVEEIRSSLKTDEGKASVPFSERRLEKMLEKAILKIITGDLSTGDMLLLKSFNYSLEKVLAVREYELGKRKEEERRREERLKLEREKHRAKMNKYRDEKRREKVQRQSTYDREEDFDFDEYNRQAVVDYENLASNFEGQQRAWSDPINSDYDEPKESKERRSKENPDNVERTETSSENLRRDFDKAMESHVVFKIRYDDSEFDSSGSDEKSRIVGKQHANRARDSRLSKYRGSSPFSKQRYAVTPNSGNSFHTSTTVSPFSSSSSSSSPSSSVSSSSSSIPVVYRLHDFNAAKLDYLAKRSRLETTTKSTDFSGESRNVADADVTEEPNSRSSESRNDTTRNDEEASTKLSVKRVSEYEGLEWVEDDVYRVIPSLADSLGDYENVEPAEYDEEAGAVPRYGSNATSFEENENDTEEYQNDAPESMKLFMANGNDSTPMDNQSLSAYQQLAIAHRRDQGQKAIEDIKSRVLALTGRFNLSANANKVQRERLTMFSPTCQTPRNTDPEAWADPFSMNMHFQLNLTAAEHVVAAKLRIYKLPQENLTSPLTGSSSSLSLSSSGSLLDDQEEEDEKKIRISVYYYTKSLRRHRAKKRLMDSVVTPLTTEGTHLAMDVRQGLRFWRLNPRNPHGNGGNHGLVIQVEDQDGRPLKPALYIQQPSCSNGDDDQKTTTYLHFSSEPVLVTFAS